MSPFLCMGMIIPICQCFSAKNSLIWVLQAEIYHISLSGISILPTFWEKIYFIQCKSTYKELTPSTTEAYCQPPTRWDVRTFVSQKSFCESVSFLYSNRRQSIDLLLRFCLYTVGMKHAKINKKHQTQHQSLANYVNYAYQYYVFKLLGISSRNWYLHDLRQRISKCLLLHFSAAMQLVPLFCLSFPPNLCWHSGTRL